jgi:hypothetical protein
MSAAAAADDGDDDEAVLHSCRYTIHGHQLHALLLTCRQTDVVDG